MVKFRVVQKIYITLVVLIEVCMEKRSSVSSDRRGVGLETAQEWEFRAVAVDNVWRFSHLQERISCFENII